VNSVLADSPAGKLPVSSVLADSPAGKLQVN